MSDVLRIGNCSGFYGDRLSAMREMLSDGELDVLTGDYLAELTMLILGKDQLKDAALGYARTFVRQAEDCLGLALSRGVRLVANAGGLNPAGLAARLREVASGLGLDVSIAHVEGDDLRSLGFPGALTANAYLGGFGIATALQSGADVVVAGRVTDASLVVGPAIAHFGWTSESYDALAGAVVCGHILECGTQATGGNFSGFLDLPLSAPLGFPLAELAADGSCVITKHPGTGGAVAVDTVTAQLVYEIQSTHYLGPDVTTDLSSISLAPDGADRVRVAGVTGSAPPSQLKVCVNSLGGFRNSAEFVLTGLDIGAKEAWLRSQLSHLQASSVIWSSGPSPVVDANTEEGASLRLRVTVLDPSAEVVGKAFTAPVVELALASYPGFTLTAPPGPASPYGIYRAEYVDRSAVTEVVVHADGRREMVPGPVVCAQTTSNLSENMSFVHKRQPKRPKIRVPLGTFVHARSGDKGGDANLGLWVNNDGHERYAERVTWLLDFVSPDSIKALLPETADLDVEVYPLPNLGAVNVLIRGLLGQGVAASTRFDPQAKGLGEWARSRFVEIPEELL